MFILSTSTVNCYTILFNRWSVQNGSVAKKCMHMHLVHQCLVNEDNTTGMYWSTIHVVLGSCCFFWHSFKPQLAKDGCWVSFGPTGSEPWADRRCLKAAQGGDWPFAFPWHL